jgi:hypothetical protein
MEDFPSMPSSGKLSPDSVSKITGRLRKSL